MYPKLTPIVSEWINDLVKQKATLRKTVNNFGSPINIHNPESFAKNIAEFDRVLKKHLKKSKIFFARKPNSSLCFVEKAVQLGIGVDVASLEELQQTLDCYCPPKDIIITAAIKDDDLCEIAVKNGVLTSVDNLDELTKLNRYARKQGKKHPIALRVGGYQFRGKKSFTRFGFDMYNLDEVFNLLSSREFLSLSFEGFHFHLNGYSLEERAEAVLQLVDTSQKIRKKGFIAKFIDMGGGFLVQYLRSKNEWDLFHRELKRAVLGQRQPITYQNNGLCYLNNNSKLINLHNLYPYFNNHAKAAALARILIKVAKKINESGIELRIEPGRSSLDQSGITLAKIVYRKIDSNGDLLVGLRMNFTQLLSSSVEFAVDPIVINYSAKPAVKVNGCFFVGSYCLERDVIQKRKIPIKAVPQVGDLVCFVNTAGYMMHFLASKSHQFASAKNLVATKKNGKYFLKHDRLNEYERT